MKSLFVRASVRKRSIPPEKPSRSWSTAPKSGNRLITLFIITAPDFSQRDKRESTRKSESERKNRASLKSDSAAAEKPYRPSQQPLSRRNKFPRSCRRHRISSSSGTAKSKPETSRHRRRTPPDPRHRRRRLPEMASTMAHLQPTIEQEPFPEIETFEFSAETLHGNPARGYLAFPKHAKRGSLPALLTLHGAGVADSDFPKHAPPPKTASSPWISTLMDSPADKHPISTGT